MGQLKFKATNTDQEWLANNFFYYSKAFSDEDDKVYIHKFPVYRWGLVTTLVAEMRLHTQNNLVTVDVYDVAGLTRGYYAPFYYEADTVHTSFVAEITKNIHEECRRLELVEWGED